MGSNKFGHIILILYYLALLLLETPLFGKVGVPSGSIRIIYIIAAVLPIWIYNRSYLPAVLFATYSVAKFGTAITFMPTEVWYYIPLLILGLFPLERGVKGASKLIPPVIVFLAIYVLLIDLITNQKVHDIVYCFIILFLLLVYVDKSLFKGDSFRELMVYMFISVATIISLELIFAGDSFIIDYGNTGMERTMWVDPNYLGCIIGMGIMVALPIIIRSNYIVRIGLLLFIAIMIIALVINASRGALLAVTGGVLIFLLGSKLKLWQKVVLIILGASFIIWMYNSGFFDLVEYRILNDTGGGSGRIEIWSVKLKAFLNDSSILQMIFGRGYEDGYVLGFGQIHRNTTAFHNDFIAFLVDYGLVGFTFFIISFFSPIKHVSFRKNTDIYANIVFLFLCCFTLEPFSLGIALFYVFWILVYIQREEISECIYL